MPEWATLLFTARLLNQPETKPQAKSLAILNWLYMSNKNTREGE
jgi:hypothetical protein